MTDWEDPHDDPALDPPIAPTQYHSQESEQVLQRLRELIDRAPNVMMSNTPRVSREELLDLVDEALVRLPEELRAARWLLKERDEFLERLEHEGDAIVAQARDRAERMVQRTEVVKASEQRAYQILDTAEAESRRLRHEVEDFCDQKLASFEIVLDRTLTMVNNGRAKLQGTALAADVIPDGDNDLFDAFAAEGVAEPLPARPDLPPPPRDDYDEDVDLA